MKRATVIIGMPGSGKTELARELEKRRKMTRQVWVFTDPIAKEIGGGKSRKIMVFLARLNRGYNPIITCPDFCDPDYLALFLESIPLPAEQIELIYFANDPERCKINARIRNRPGRVDWECNWIDKLSKTYKPVNPRPVWTP